MGIERVEPERITDADREAYHRLLVACSQVDWPDDPEPIYQRAVSGLAPLEISPWVWLARDADGGLVGMARQYGGDNENAHLAQASVNVRPDARRRGLGRELFERLRQEAVTAGRTGLVGQAPAFDPAAGFARAMGAEPKMFLTRRVLRVDRAVPDLVELAGGSASRTEGFSLVRWTGPCPDDLVDAYAGAWNGMNDAPMGDSGVNPVEWTAKRVRERESIILRPGWHRYVVVARDDATGAVAGLTQVDWPVGSPVAYQDDTTVLSTYRGRGFGVWLKAAMVGWLRTECPDVVQYETQNAEDNPHMVAVNERLGYTEAGRFAAWETPVG